MSFLKKFFVLFSLGASLYSLIEVLWRGFTHWSMSLAGGLCMCGIYVTNDRFKGTSGAERCFLCSLMITVVEFITGVIMNIGLGMKIWDYSKRPFNILGQICLLYSFFWFLLSFPAISICNFLREKVFDKM